MCGIAGFIDYKDDLSEELLVQMTDAMVHRGPDDSGYKIIQVNNARIGLGHRRLSIIDLTATGHQPMMFKQYTIVFNGEIYNYKEIRKELEAEGYQFDSPSDTAVMLRAFDRWGLDALHKFIGMFSFCLLDQKNETVYLVRDRAGVKPLYYYAHDSTFLFASELKAFHALPSFNKSISYDALNQYFLYGYILAPNTIFQHASKVKPGHYIKYNLKTKEQTEIKYWDVADGFRKPKLNISESEAITETEKLLKSAFDYRMVADVPVGVFLSGGYDSSTVAALLQKDSTARIKTFTIGFNMTGYDEAKFAKEVANYLGTDHTELYCTEKEAEEILPELPHFYDEPFGDSSAIPTILVSRLAKKQVTVALSADGGDELFGGYKKHHSALQGYKWLSMAPKLLQPSIGTAMSLYPPKLIPFSGKQFRFDHLYRSAASLLKKGVAVEQIMRLSSHHLDKQKLSKLFKEKVQEPASNFDQPDFLLQEQLDYLLLMDYKTYMVDDILVKVDRATMSVSLEGREPFLDHRIAEFVSTLPSNFKIKNGSKKHLLKQITHKYIPKAMMDRPKMGFAIPVEHWFRKDLNSIFSYYLSEERIRKQGIFNYEVLKQIIQKYLEGSDEDFEFLWAMIVFQLWADKWLDKVA